MDLSYFRLVHELLRLMFEFMNFSVFPWTKCGFMNICNKVHELMDFLYKVHELGYSSWMLPTGSWTWWTIVNTAFMNCIHEPIWWTFDEFWQIIHVQFMNNSWMFISSWMFMNCISPGIRSKIIDSHWWNSQDVTIDYDNRCLFHFESHTLRGGIHRFHDKK